MGRKLDFHYSHPQYFFLSLFLFCLTFSLGWFQADFPLSFYTILDFACFLCNFQIWFCFQFLKLLFIIFHLIHATINIIKRALRQQKPYFKLQTCLHLSKSKLELNLRNETRKRAEIERRVKFCERRTCKKWNNFVSWEKSFRKFCDLGFHPSDAENRYKLKVSTCKISLNPVLEGVYLALYFLFVASWINSSASSDLELCQRTHSAPFLYICLA